MRKLLMIAAAAIGIAAAPASANYIFSGIGTSGTLVSATETWVLGCPAGGPGCPAGTTGWGSPGVSLSVTQYGEAQTAIDFEIHFIGATIDPGQIAVGAAAGCAGTETGGTTFCDASDAIAWTANLVDASTIHFVDPTGTGLTTGQLYFVNIFLVGDVARVDFTGAWSTVPEPTTLALLGIALAGVGFARRRRMS